MSGLWSRSQESAEAARVLLARELYNAAASAAYFAMFNAGRALLEKKVGIAPEEVKRHATVLRLFSHHFIRSGRFDVELGREFRRAAEARGIADYHESSLDCRAAHAIVEAMERFLVACAQLFHQDDLP